MHFVGDPVTAVSSGLNFEIQLQARTRDSNQEEVTWINECKYQYLHLSTEVNFIHAHTFIHCMFSI